MSISSICRQFLSARQNIDRMFVKYYRNCQDITISWVYYPSRKTYAKTHTKLTFLGFFLNSKTMTDSDRCQKKKKNIKLGKDIINWQYIIR